MRVGEWLAGAKEYIDVICDQSLTGEMRVVEGTHHYSTRANWKLLAENSVDGYHGIPTHQTYLQYLLGAGGVALEDGRMLEGRAHSLGNGHAAIEYWAPQGRPVARWVPMMGEESKPEIEAVKGALAERYGAERADRIGQLNRNILIYPNLVINDLVSVIVRTFNPVEPDFMEITAWALAPVEEQGVRLQARLHSFLEFFGPGGLPLRTMSRRSSPARSASGPGASSGMTSRAARSALLRPTMNCRCGRSGGSGRRRSRGSNAGTGRCTACLGIRCGWCLVSVAIVTGASRNIGRAIAERLLADGMDVAVADVDAEVIAQTGAELDPSGDRVLAHAADLSTYDGARSLCDVTLDRWGRIDALVNNAGGGVIRPFLQHDEESIAETISRNLMTTIHCCRSVLPAMTEQGSGRIVNLGAESVRNGLWWHAMYNAAKGGVHGLTTGLAREFAPNGITVNSVAPSIVATDEVKQAIAAGDQLPAAMKTALDQTLGTIPLGRPATLQEVADVVAFLAGERSGFVTGQVISVNGGSSML